MTDTMSCLTHLECPVCGKREEPDRIATFCKCGSPLFATYDTGEAAGHVGRGEFPSFVRSLWRYSQMLPVRSVENVISLGEGWTPLLRSRALGEYIGVTALLIKDETRNPTLSFKDRGMSVTVSRHIELGGDLFVLPSAGNAAVALSAYCAAAGVTAQVFMPSDTPIQFARACEMYGAQVTLVDGTISECGAVMRKQTRQGIDLSTTREPYRVEGKKTIAFEIAEQMGWSIPDAIICPTGGGTAIVGIWKGMNELEQLGLIDESRPRLYSVQSTSCAPIVDAVERGSEVHSPCPECHTSALGLRVPDPFAGRLILKAIHDTDGGAISVTEEEMQKMQVYGTRVSGLDIGPESAVGLAGLKKLIELEQIQQDETVVVLNTGTATRYMR